MIELTEVMRQRSGPDFTRLPNKLREGKIDEDVEHTLKARFWKQNHILNMLCICLQKINQLKDIMKLN